METDSLHFAAGQISKAEQTARDLRRDLLGGEPIDSTSIDGLFAKLMRDLALAGSSVHGVRDQLRRLTD